MAQVVTAGQARLAVISRDGGCVAPIIDPKAGPCYDSWGLPLPTKNAPVTSLEVDRIRDEPMMGKAPKHGDPSRMVALCPGHHRGMGPQGGYIWATAHRPEIREYLDRKVPSRRVERSPGL